MKTPGPGLAAAHSLAALLLVASVATPRDALGASAAAPVSGATEAALERAAAEPIWRALLHQQRRRLDRKARATLHEAEFFFHPQGDTRPDLELAATRAAMEDPSAPDARAARCRFPARHQFLYQRGLVTSERGECAELDRWRATIGDIELTLVFPEAFLGNPSSMFGHSLLRFDPAASRRGDGDTAQALLGWTLDFTADTGEDTGVLQMMLGLFGRYRGRFGVAPYYEKIQLYNDWQDRDIWEYPLSMPAEARERLLLHVWEMRGAELPYYFFTRNCADRLLEMIEVGWPGMGRGGGAPPGVTPVDTLRAMAKSAPGAVGEPRLRPSPASRLQLALAELSRADANWVEALAAGDAEPDDERLARLPTERRARVLELSYELLRHTFISGGIPAEESRTRSNALLRARSALRIPAAPEPSTALQARTPPHRGHGTARLALNGGIQADEGFIELRAQPGFHTALDAPGGFAEGGEIRLFDTALRVYPKQGRVRLHELVVLDVTTASPWRRPFRPLAWHSDFGLRTRVLSRDPGRGLELRSIFRAQAGLGAAFAPARGLLLYGFGEIVVEAAPAIVGKAAAGPLARVGLTWSTPGGGYTLRADTTAGMLAGRDTSPWWKATLEQRATLTREWSLVLGGHFERAYDAQHVEGRLGLTRYF